MAKGLINKFKERLYDLMPQLLDSVDQQAENIMNANVVASVKATIIELGTLIKGGTRENNVQYIYDIIVAACSRELTVHNVRDILGVRKHAKHNNVTAQETPSSPALDLSPSPRVEFEPQSNRAISDSSTMAHRGAPMVVVGGRRTSSTVHASHEKKREKKCLSFLMKISRPGLGQRKQRIDSNGGRIAVVADRFWHDRTDISTDLPRILIQPVNGGPADYHDRRIILNFLALPVLVLREVDLRRLINEDEARHRTITVDEPSVQSEVSDEVVADPVLAASHSFHRDRAIHTVCNDS